MTGRNAVRMLQLLCAMGHADTVQRALAATHTVTADLTNVELGPGARKLFTGTPGFCACGKRISENKTQCKACANA